VNCFVFERHLVEGPRHRVLVETVQRAGVSAVGLGGDLNGQSQADGSDFQRAQPVADQRMGSFRIAGALAGMGSGRAHDNRAYGGAQHDGWQFRLEEGSRHGVFLLEFSDGGVVLFVRETSREKISRIHGRF
jgi:hypothetical protein